MKYFKSRNGFKISIMCSQYAPNTSKIAEYCANKSCAECLVFLKMMNLEVPEYNASGDNVFEYHFIQEGVVLIFANERRKT